MGSSTNKNILSGKVFCLLFVQVQLKTLDWNTANTAEAQFSSFSFWKQVNNRSGCRLRTLNRWRWSRTVKDTYVMKISSQWMDDHLSYIYGHEFYILYFTSVIANYETEPHLLMFHLPGMFTIQYIVTNKKSLDYRFSLFVCHSSKITWITVNY